MADCKGPRAVELVDELPFNDTGKVRKDVLRAQVANLQRPGPDNHEPTDEGEIDEDNRPGADRVRDPR